jgi:hypothetical protein
LTNGWPPQLARKVDFSYQLELTRGERLVSEKRSKYAEAGSPNSCFLSSCNKAFWPECTRGSDGHYYCSQECADKCIRQDLREAKKPDGKLSKKAAQIFTVSQCIDHCFSFDMWCSDFAKNVDPDDMMMGLDRAFDLVSDATRLHSFLALRKLDDFFRAVKSKPDDLIASELGIDATVVLGGSGKMFLTPTERDDINKGAAHLTERLTLNPDSEFDLQAIVERSIPVFERLSSELRKADVKREAEQWLDKTDALLKHACDQADRNKTELAARGISPRHRSP